MKFEVHHNCEVNGELHQCWSNLARSPLEHPDWLLTWWNVFSLAEDGRTLFLVAVYDNDDTLVGISPLYRQNGILRLLGSGTICTDHQQLIVGTDDPNTSLALIEWLCRRPKDWNLLDLECIDRFSPLELAIDSPAFEKSALGRKTPFVGNCQVALPATWEEYLGQLSKNHRKRCRRWWRSYFESGRITTESTLNGWNEGIAFETLRELHNQRRIEVGDSGFFESPLRAAFLRHAYFALAERKQVEISAIRLDGEVVAVEFELIGTDTIYAYQSCIAMSAKEHSPFYLSLLHRIRSAIESGKTEFDFMRGCEEYKSHWQATTTSTSRIRIRPKNRRGQFTHTSSIILDQSVNLVRQAVGR